MKMGVNLCGVELKNPVIAASGTFGFGREYDEFYDVGGLGGISVKGLTRLPRLGLNAQSFLRKLHALDHQRHLPLLADVLAMPNPGIGIGT